MKFYIVTEEITNEFDGMFIDEDKARARARQIGGWVSVYDISEAIVMDEHGELVSSHDFLVKG